MVLDQFEDKGLSQFSYAVGCPGAGRVAIVDPRREIGVYLDYATRTGLEIGWVLETHIHADFASGASELAARTGAELCLSSYDSGELYEVKFPHRELRDGEAIEFGAVRLEACHTPGHTPEHLSYLVYDRSRSRDVPQIMLSGDFLFVGSLGRPDLLGEDAKIGLARQLYGSVKNKLADLPDGLEIHPGHGAGSMCGAGMSGRGQSTLGFERIANPYLAPGLDEKQFVDMILGNVPPLPDYYPRMKQLNADGPAPLHGRPTPPAMAAGEFKQARDSGHVVVDARNHEVFTRIHIPNSLGIGAGDSFAQWAAWVVPYSTPILLVASQPEQIAPLTAALASVGLDDVRGYLDGGFDAWLEAGYPISEWELIDSRELHDRIESGSGMKVVDVRNDGEWAAGHLEQAQHIMAGYMPQRAEEVGDGDDPVAVVCASGYRSAIAASVLERAGARNLVNVSDGMLGWVRSGLPVVK